MPDIFLSKNKTKKGAARNKKVKNKSNVPETEINTPKDPEEKEIHETIKKPPNPEEAHKLKGHSHNPLASYCYYPDKAHFVNEDPQERVVLLLRKHPITNINWIITAFLMIIAPTFVSIFPFFVSLPTGFKIVSIIIWYLIIVAFIFEQFLSWFFHVNIVTDERILEVDFINLIYREMTDANIDQIQDVTVEVGGATRTFLNYGNVVIQTAGEVPRINFESVPKPDKVAKVLRELRIEEEREKLEGRVR